ncbi:multicomponent Na+:H+ antiporter subunit D [Alkalispirochaeta americana]|uniref:Multicomponent Na+:H+ antiporter subunit D n=1 Tax=Alkalispirochaeta americana TaxID=159291 RepID=A0A1N6T5K9_9SPIO|nr:proton-conducting transporter membrane subunit [Alkalispirochaeta americana]SIQ48668.1 multicomponent Na+:H+ antiporter subunit D [Alkalispirochaeta americana]
MGSDQALLFPVLLPLAGAVLGLLAETWHARRVGWACALTGIASGFAVFLILALRGWSSGALPLEGVVGGWAPEVGILLILDFPAAVFGPLLYGVSFFILLFASGDRSLGCLFAAVFSIAVAGVGGVVLAGDLFNIFVFFEVLSLCAVILIAFQGRASAMYAAFRYLVVGAVSIAFYLLGLFFLYRATGELALRPLLAHISSAGELSSSLRLGLACMIGSVAMRVALVPFHGWLPSAHGEAPTAVSAFLSGVLLKTGVVVLYRLLLLIQAGAEYPLVQALLWMGVVSAFLGAFAAFFQSDVKRLLAYSSISQLGYVAAALAAGALGAALFHGVAHALFKSLLFLLVGRLAEGLGTHDFRMLRSKGGMRCSSFLEGVAFLVAVAAVMGLPGFSGFAGKQLVLAGVAAIEVGPAGKVAYWVLKAAALGTAASFGTLFLLMIAPGTKERVVRVSPREQIALLVLLAGVLFQGVVRVDLVRLGSSLEALGFLIAGGFLVALRQHVLLRPSREMTSGEGCSTCRLSGCSDSFGRLGHALGSLDGLILAMLAGFLVLFHL